MNMKPMKVLQSVTIAAIEDRGWLKMRVNFVDGKKGTVQGMIKPIKKLNGK
jgi:hypothetical protein